MELTKKCTKCLKIKPLQDFHKRTKSPDGHATKCKECVSIYYKALQGEAREKRRASSKRYYYQHYEKMKHNGKQWYRANREYAKELTRRWKQNHKENVAEQTRESRKRRRARDPVYAHRIRLQALVRWAFNKQGKCTSPTIQEICGCSPFELYTFLCQTWEQHYGKAYNGEKCQIDHITPLRTATTIQDINRLYHYTNLQLLTPYDNFIKG